MTIAGAGPDQLPRVVRTLNTMDGAPQLNDRNYSLDLALACPTELRACLRRICSWRIPPNWCAADWFEEIRAFATCVAWEAQCQFDPSYGVPLDGFVYSRVMGRALARYRREWAFGAHCIGEVVEQDRNVLSGNRALRDFSGQDSAGDGLLEALTGLSDQNAWLIKQLFWEDRTQAEIGRELGTSQRAVSKRKQAALQALRRLLNGSETKKTCDRGSKNERSRQ